MRQAIEEEFVLNPIACYTVYTDKLKARKKDGAEGEYDSARTAAASPSISAKRPIGVSSTTTSGRAASANLHGVRRFS